MDTFMDKLAQKLTAQEIIKANTAAEAEEMNNLKEQVKEYREILERMQKLVEESAAKLENTQVDGDAIERRIAEGIAKMNLQAEENAAKAIQQTEENNAKIKNLLEESTERINRMQQGTQEFDKLREELNQLGESLKQMEEAFGTKLTDTSENVHKECVKVYRNVQAVVVEENNKQTEKLVAEVKSLKGKQNAIMGISIAALIAALGGVIFQILAYFM